MSTWIESAFDPIPRRRGRRRSYGHLAAAVSASGRRPRAHVMDVLIALDRRSLVGQILLDRLERTYEGSTR